MKNLISLFSIALLSVLIFNACDNNPLDIQPPDQITEEVVWEDVSLIKAYLSEVYRGMGHGLYHHKLSANTDNGHPIPVRNESFVQSNINSSDRGIFDAFLDRDYYHYSWDHLYDKIRQLNIFIEEIDNSAIEDQNVKDQLKGEAHFLRAYFYHNLLRMYGGVPIITEVYGLNDDMNVPRNSFGETVSFIVQEAESAAGLLPTVRTGENLGRASAGAALALKSRILLYAASDLYHENPSDMVETGYTGSQNQTQMWRDAKNAAQAVIDLDTYSLFRPNPADKEEAEQNYEQLFRTPNTSEAILELYRSEETASTVDPPYNPNLHHGPNGYHMFGSNTPTQQLVDAYKMADGSEFSWENPSHASAPYENRDPRFYATIAYDGAEYRERPADTKDRDEDGVIQTFLELNLPDGTTVSGLDTRNSNVEPWNGTYTGYYMRKFIDVSKPPETGPQSGVWPFFRYAEILLNYAEASIELGEFGDARDALNRIRVRAGMPEIGSSVTGQELSEHYRNERRIELVYEEHRYFDIRRWMIAPDVMDVNAKGIEINAEATDRADRSTYTNYEYEVISVQNRAWDNKMYFMPISQDEMNRNSELVQNPGF
ncbi:RagB/SusD family nutrient uptake outer membrane protein [Halalkalibaculum sp. DA3122]|uniref:RagB/SusD family nutrient uptake outer membrane protein n=1 Tax=Halalkalibaculum sp. DA3122 TaxID=3373607 RepID=UPI003754D693